MKQTNKNLKESLKINLFNLSFPIKN